MTYQRYSPYVMFTLDFFIRIRRFAFLTQFNQLLPRISELLNNGGYIALVSELFNFNMRQDITSFVVYYFSRIQVWLRPIAEIPT